jgi:hypothetical protein
MSYRSRKKSHLPELSSSRLSFELNPIVGTRVEPPKAVKVWLETTSDAAMASMIVSKLETGIAFDVAVAIGLFARLRKDEPGHAAALVSAAKGDAAGSAAAELEAAPYVWVGELAANALSSLKHTALAVVTELVEALQQLEQAADEGDERYATNLRAFLYRRDDLEGVAMLLAERGVAGDVDAALMAIDDEGALFVRSAPVCDEIKGDERLSRALSLDPESWWALPSKQG